MKERKAVKATNIDEFKELFKVNESILFYDHEERRWRPGTRRTLAGKDEVNIDYVNADVAEISTRSVKISYIRKLDELELVLQEQVRDLRKNIDDGLQYIIRICDKMMLDADTAKEKFKERFEVDPVGAIDWRAATVIYTEYQARYARAILKEIRDIDNNPNLDPVFAAIEVFGDIEQLLKDEQLRWTGSTSTSLVSNYTEQKRAEARTNLLGFGFVSYFAHYKSIVDRWQEAIEVLQNAFGEK